MDTPGYDLCMSYKVEKLWALVKFSQLQGTAEIPTKNLSDFLLQLISHFLQDDHNLWRCSYHLRKILSQSHAILNPFLLEYPVPFTHISFTPHFQIWTWYLLCYFLRILILSVKFMCTGMGTDRAPKTMMCLILSLRTVCFCKLLNTYCIPDIMLSLENTTVYKTWCLLRKLC